MTDSDHPKISKKKKKDELLTERVLSERNTRLATSPISAIMNGPHIMHFIKSHITKSPLSIFFLESETKKHIVIEFNIYIYNFLYTLVNSNLQVKQKIKPQSARFQAFDHTKTYCHKIARYLYSSVTSSTRMLQERKNNNDVL